MFKKIKLIKIGSVICLTGIAFAVSDIDEKLDRLLDNQKVILTRLQKLEKTQNDLVRKVNTAPVANKNQKPQVDYNKEYKIPVGDSVILGNPSAKITITEWMEFQ